MSDYTIIAKVSRKITERLQKLLVPGLIADASSICLCSPEEHKDVSLGIFLYDMRESEEVRHSGMVRTGADRKSGPPVYMELYYMITAYVSGDQRFGMIEEEKILGKIIQYFHDYPVIPFSKIMPDAQAAPDLRISMSPMDGEQKMKLWNFGGQPYRLSLFYRIAPVTIASARVQAVTRVTEVEVNVENKNNPHT